jgi:teichuronic acid biosynthesis glycosyltransferase TuaG
MRNRGIVSIITPAYNAGRFIAETMRSVLGQTYDYWEMIIVDDCSTDETCVIVERAKAEDSRIQLIKHSRNRGPAGARNTGLEMAQGRFIAFLDSDDMWLPTKIEKQLLFMSEKNAVFSFTQYRRIIDMGNKIKIGRVIKIPPQISYEDLLKNTAIATSTVIIDREATGPFQMKDTYYDDYALWLDILKRGFTADGLREDLVRYRVVGKSVSRNKVNSAKCVWRTYRKVENLNWIISAWCFLNYTLNAFVKYRKF